MKIATRERGPRTHSAAGRQWTFQSESPDGPAVCDVTDPTAAAVFLKHEGLFRALDPAAPLERKAKADGSGQTGQAGQQQNPSGAGAATTPDPAAVEHDAQTLVDFSVRELRNTLAKVSFPLATLQRALAIEQAAGDKARTAVTTALEAAIQRVQAG